jgi:quinol monooxygenase YgiN
MEIAIPEVSSGPIGVYGFARARPGREAELEKQMLAFVEAARREPGSLQYQVHRDVADPTTLVFYELWRSTEDLHRHLGSPELARFGENSAYYLREDMDIRWLLPISVETPGD